MPRHADVPREATKNTRELSATITAMRSSGEPWERHLGEWAANLHPGSIEAIEEHLGISLQGDNSLFSPESMGENSAPLLAALTVGEMGIIYEAILALEQPASRKENGQFFTPDDAAAFMASQSRKFPEEGMWIDPCCGVGNLSWHLADTKDDSMEFLSTSLTLMDRDEKALRSAALILAASFSTTDEEFQGILSALRDRSTHRSALDMEPWPEHDYVLMNPPYGKAPRADRGEYPNTWSSGELYAYFLERAAPSQGIIAVVPASLTSAHKYSTLRELYLARSGGEVYSFDNMPTRLFKDFKYGSTNTSQHNQVRAAILVSTPTMGEWRATPMLRWSTASRARMFRGAEAAMAPLIPVRHQGRWGRLPRGTQAIWEGVESSDRTLSDLTTEEATPWSLHIAATPRYYITGTPRDLQRGNKHVLHFPDEESYKEALLYLNSALPYWWWRFIDGGIIMPRGLLLAAPLPEVIEVDEDLVKEVLESDGENLVVKVNAGSPNENVKHPRVLVERLTEHLLGAKIDLDGLYAPDMFPAVEGGMMGVSCSPVMVPRS